MAIQNRTGERRRAVRKAQDQWARAASAKLDALLAVMDFGAAAHHDTRPAGGVDRTGACVDARPVREAWA